MKPQFNLCIVDSVSDKKDVRNHTSSCNEPSIIEICYLVYDHLSNMMFQISNIIKCQVVYPEFENHIQLEVAL